MGRRIKAEICVDSLESVVAIHRISEEFSHRVPWRIELCSNLIAGGGLTPSMGLLQVIRTHFRKLLPDLEIMVMIRPRTGPFVYSATEIDTMIYDIEAFGREGVHGFVFGCSKADGSIDLRAASILSSECMHKCVQRITFHRAFDLTPNWQEAYDSLANINKISCWDEMSITHILTSGQANNVSEGLGNLKAMIERAKLSTATPTPIRILPGSGINADMLPDFLEQLPDITELHLSASEPVECFTGPSVDRGAELGFGDGRVWKLNEDKLRRVFQILSDLQDA